MIKAGGKKVKKETKKGSTKSKVNSGEGSDDLEEEEPFEEEDVAAAMDFI